jgi:nitroimidazol reductase NimA-like FMN-containing flavoprotein (pyridoxamine 5'-phosphate oxidase superfamily)
VTYAVHDGTIIFRTSPYGVLSELIRPTDVALEIDELDQESRRGWSVVVQGRAQGVAEPAQLVRIWTVGGLVPWASGVRNVFIQIIPQRITGRDVPARSI